MNQEMKIVRNDEIAIDDWNQLLSRVDHPSYFQSPKGFQELRKFNDWQVQAIGCIANGELLAVLVYVIQKEKGIKAFFSKRCIIFSGPLFTDDFALREILLHLDKLATGCVYLEIRNGYSTYQNANVYRELGWQYVPWLNFIVQTSDKETMMKGMSESRRRQLRKSEKLGVQLSNPKEESEVVDFYRILLQLYQDRIKKPLPEYNLFKLYYKSNPKNFVLVYHDHKVIGGILCPYLEGVAVYEFYIAGLDQEYKDCYPSAMATFGAMNQAYEMGIPYFDFMGGGSPDDGYGVRDFKSRFGGEQVEWGRWLKIRNRVIYQLGKFYIQWRGK